MFTSLLCERTAAVITGKLAKNARKESEKATQPTGSQATYPKIPSASSAGSTMVPTPVPISQGTPRSGSNASMTSLTQLTVNIAKEQSNVEFGAKATHAKTNDKSKPEDNAPSYESAHDTDTEHMAARWNRGHGEPKKYNKTVNVKRIWIPKKGAQGQNKEKGGQPKNRGMSFEEINDIIAKVAREGDKSD